MTKNSRINKFLKLAKPDPESGYSKPVPINILEANGLGFGNGGSWCRDDSSLGKIYNIERIKQGNRIIAVQLNGKRKNPIGKNIPTEIRKQIHKQRCKVLGTSKPECDHKDGRRDDPRLNDPELVTIEDFQPLSKAANNAKKQHCKNCRETNKRFDAKQLGYSVSQWAGNGRYMGSCVGCYWYDPFNFNQKISK